MLGFKGFSKELKCNDMQYEIGKTFKENFAKLCCYGLHFCEYPLDVFNYYSPADSRYCEVEADDVTDETSGDSKRVCKTLTVKAEIGLPGLCKAAVEYIKERVDWKNKKEINSGYSSAAVNSGYRSAAVNSGYRSAAVNSGDSSAAVNSGYRSAAVNSGYSSAAVNSGDSSAAEVSGGESVACALGIDSSAKGALGCWLVLAEWAYYDSQYHRVNVKCRKVDGKHIKPDTYYKLVNNNFVEV